MSCGFVERPALLTCQRHFWAHANGSLREFLSLKQRFYTWCMERKIWARRSRGDAVWTMMKGHLSHISCTFPNARPACRGVYQNKHTSGAYPESIFYQLDVMKGSNANLNFYFQVWAIENWGSGGQRKTLPPTSYSHPFTHIKALWVLIHIVSSTSAMFSYMNLSNWKVAYNIGMKVYYWQQAKSIKYVRGRRERGHKQFGPYCLEMESWKGINIITDVRWWI